jgi:hypothetical protein
MSEKLSNVEREHGSGKWDESKVRKYDERCVGRKN